MKSTRATMRLLHRYIGYFMAGIMAVYAISGVLLIYRDTDFLKKEKKFDKKIEINIPKEKLGKELKIKNLEVKEQKGNLLIFKEGTYNSKTGEAKYTKKELPYFLKKMTDLLNEKEKLIIVEEKKYIPQLKYENGDILRDMVVATFEKSLINQSFKSNDEKIIIKSNKKPLINEGFLFYLLV